ncbi:MAG: hypothetical protein OXE57_09130 [Alphaproteobacteria bacterium]|nr:hypothetical protein [Alphaproteobacteria bacterium]
MSHFATEQTKSFSTHAIAEELHIGKQRVVEEFDRIELELLKRFFDFVKDNNDKIWVHWNMRNLVYGFEHLEHRYIALSNKTPNSIPMEMRVNLNDIIADRYGGKYVKIQKCQNSWLVMVVGIGIFFRGRRKWMHSRTGTISACTIQHSVKWAFSAPS